MGRLYILASPSLLILAFLITSNPYLRKTNGYPQKLETYFKTFYVAVTEIAFESQPSVCISLVNANKPCISSSSQSDKLQLFPSTVLIGSTSTIIEPTDDISSSIEEIRATKQQPNFFQILTRGFSNALGLTRTVISSVIETKTMTTTYTETKGLTYFEIRDCIPPVLHYPICKGKFSEIDP